MNLFRDSHGHVKGIIAEINRRSSGKREQHPITSSPCIMCTTKFGKKIRPEDSGLRGGRIRNYSTTLCGGCPSGRYEHFLRGNRVFIFRTYVPARPIAARVHTFLDVRRTKNHARIAFRTTTMHAFGYPKKRFLCAIFIIIIRTTIINNYYNALRGWQVPVYVR